MQTRHLMARNQLQQTKRIVIKIGTQTILQADSTFNHSLATNLAKQIHSLQKQGKEIIIVSSGAIGLGNQELEWKRSKDMTLNQCAAAIGQNRLMHAYYECFNAQGLKTAQILLTPEDSQEEEHKKMVRNLIEKLLEKKVVPIINENDSVATAEISFGDNDLLSAYITNALHADLLILFSNVNGVYENMARKTVIPFITQTQTIEALAGAPGENGRGGMRSKIMAARIAAQTNARTMVANGNEKNALLRIMKGESLGTLFCLNAPRIGLIGTGQLGKKILERLHRQGFTIAATDRKKQTINGISAGTDNRQNVHKNDIIILTVKPSQLNAVAREVGETMNGKLLISFAAGIRIRQLKKMFNARIVRAMTNLALESGKAFTGYAAQAGISESERRELIKILQALGAVTEVSEENLDTLTAVSGSGIAFMMHYLEQFRQFGAQNGLNEKDARQTALETMKGAVELMEKNKDTAELIARVASRGGTTEEGLLELEKQRVPQSIQSVLQKALQKCQQISETHE